MVAPPHLCFFKGEKMNFNGKISLSGRRRGLAVALLALVSIPLVFFPLTHQAGATVATPIATFNPRSKPIPSVQPNQAQVAAIGESLPRINCPVGYTAAVYAEGLSSPDGLAFSPDGLLYVAEESAGQVSRIEANGVVTPVLGGLTNPEGLAFDQAGTLYVVEDVPDGRLVKLNPAGITTTLVTGLAAPEGVAVAADGTVYVTESNVQYSSRLADIRTWITAVDTAGLTSTVRLDAFYWSYAGLTIGADGLLYVTNEAAGLAAADSVFAVHPATGIRSPLASHLLGPEGLRFAAGDNFPLYVAEEDSTGAGDGQLSRVEANGAHIPLCTGFYTIEDIILDQAGQLYVSEDSSGLVIRIQASPPEHVPAQAIILFIGDGMGEPHRTAARWSTAGQRGTLAMDTLPMVGWSRTASANNPVTDSAAGGTAIATGVKTNNGVVGLDPDGNVLVTILEQARAQGKAVGLVTTTQMAHATPASFAAHVPDRLMMTEIARQMLANGVEVLLGGGEDEFLPTTATGCYPQPGERADGRNLIAEAMADGYTYVCDAAGLAAVEPDSTNRLLGLLADEELPRPFAISLAELTRRAIDILDQDPDGFFLMVEGGQIDWAAHNNDAANVITDTIGLDEAVAVAQTYAVTNPHTLIIVTADHETGGMSVSLTPGGEVGDENDPFLMPNSATFYVNWSSIYHSGVDVPVTAQGPWSDLLAGIYENTHIYSVMSQALRPQAIWLPLILRQ